MQRSENQRLQSKQAAKPRGSRQSWARFGGRTLGPAVVLSCLALGAAQAGCTGQIKGDGPAGNPPGDPNNNPMTPVANGGSGPGVGAGGSGAVGQPQPPGVEGIGYTTRIPRLSHTQWENTVRDLMKLDAAPELAQTFSLDPDVSRFDSYSAHLVSSNLWSDYQRAAEAVAADVAQDPTKLARIAPQGAATDTTAFVTEFGRRAFRRPLAQTEIDTYVTLFGQGQELMGGDAFVSGVEMVLRAILQSPNFIYRVESSTTPSGDKIWLSGYEMASRLSYGLWNSMPSDALLNAAEAGELNTPEGVANWTRNLLTDVRAREALVSFHEQLFNVTQFGTIAKNETLFPDFTLDLAPVLQDEARLFLEEILFAEDGGIGSLLTRPVTFVNQETAQFYGLSGNFGASLQRVELDPTRRAGILTHLGFLSKYASQTQSDPILRGVHISLDIICSALPAPPANIPPLPEIQDNQTNRQRVEVATSEAPCNTCHEVFINPLGFAFENYDAVGAWRDTDNGQPVNAAASFTLDGNAVNYNGPLELSQLLAQSPSVHACYSGDWLEYMIGRPPSSEETGIINNLGQVSQSGATLSDLLANLTTLETFRARPLEVVSP